jgi:hypothetical protein
MLGVVILIQYHASGRTASYIGMVVLNPAVAVTPFVRKAIQSPNDLVPTDLQWVPNAEYSWAEYHQYFMMRETHNP